MKPTYISFGAGVQSSALLCLAEKGEINCVRGALFADTGSEPQSVYDWLDFIKQKIKKIPIHIIKSERGNLHDYALKGSHNPVPLHGIVKSDNFYKSIMGRRSCTFLFKILPIQQKIRKLEGIKKYARLPKDSISLALGISKDESHRAKPSRIPWIQNIYPLLDRGLYRKDCADIVHNFLGRFPPRSACVFCPYLSNKNFSEIKKNKSDWNIATDFDDKCRNQNNSVIQYVHRSKVPLRDAEVDDLSGQISGFLDSCEEAHCGL